MTYQLIYPERRQVSADQLRTWAADNYVNGLDLHPDADWDDIWLNKYVDLTVDRAIFELEDDGHITLGN